MGISAIRHVVRHFDVNRTLVTQAGIDAADDFRGSALFIEQHRARDRDFVVDASLRFERLHLVMEQRIFFAIFPARRAADDYDGRFLRIGTGNGVQDVEASHAIGDADQTDAVDARVSVGGEPGAGLVCHGHTLDL